MCGLSCHRKKFSVLQCNSILMLTELTRLHRLRTQSHQTAPTSDTITHRRSPGHSQLLFDLATNQRSPSPLLLGLNYLLEESLNSGKHLSLPSYYIIKGMVKAADELPEEETHGMRSRMVPSTGASVPTELECSIIPVQG